MTGTIPNRGFGFESGEAGFHRDQTRYPLMKGMSKMYEYSSLPHANLTRSQSAGPKQTSRTRIHATSHLDQSRRFECGTSPATGSPFGPSAGRSAILSVVMFAGTISTIATVSRHYAGREQSIRR